MFSFLLVKELTKQPSFHSRFGFNYARRGRRETLGGCSQISSRGTAQHSRTIQRNIILTALLQKIQFRIFANFQKQHVSVSASERIYSGERRIPTGEL